jgi:hypothetical protein
MDTQLLPEGTQDPGLTELVLARRLTRVSIAGPRSPAQPVDPAELGNRANRGGAEPVAQELSTGEATGQGESS